MYWVLYKGEVEYVGNVESRATEEIARLFDSDADIDKVELIKGVSMVFDIHSEETVVTVR